MRMDWVEMRGRFKVVGPANLSIRTGVPRSLLTRRELCLLVHQPTGWVFVGSFRFWPLLPEAEARLSADYPHIG